MATWQRDVASDPRFGTRICSKRWRLAFYVALEPLVLESVCGSRFMSLWNHWFWEAFAACVLCWFGTIGFGKRLRLAFYVGLEPLVSGSVGGSRFMLAWNHWFWEALAARVLCWFGTIGFGKCLQNALLA